MARGRAPGKPGNGHPLVAALHLGPEPGDVAGNLRLADRAVTAAKRAHPALRWVVLPELFTTGYAGLSSIHEHAEDAEHGASAAFFAYLARRLGLYVAYGFPERRRSGGVSDSANLVGPWGHLLTYRKRRLVRTTNEPAVFVPGHDVPVAWAGGARIALVICWDLGSPEAVREAALKGADLVLAPAGWRHPWGRQYGLACAARALDNAVYLASANQLVGRLPRGPLRHPRRRLRPARRTRLRTRLRTRAHRERRRDRPGAARTVATILR
jgi:5-aminopentanamidase